MLATVIGILAIVVILFLAIRYIYKEKKKGTVCIGCPIAGSCTKHSCASEADAEKMYAEIKKSMEQ